jgi:hypothetical protein
MIIYNALCAYRHPNLSKVRCQPQIYNRSQWKNAGPNSQQGKQQYIQEHENKNAFWQFGIGIGDELFSTIGVLGKVIKTVGRPINYVTGFNGVENAGRGITKYTDFLSSRLDNTGYNRKGVAAGLGQGFTFIATSFVGVGLATKAVKATKLVPVVIAGAKFVAKKPIIGMPLRSVAKNAGRFERASNFKQNAGRALAAGAAVKAYSDVTTQDEFGNRDYRAIVSDAVLIPAGYQWINATRTAASKNAIKKLMGVKIASGKLSHLIASSLKATRQFTPFFNAKVLLRIDQTLTNQDVILINALQLRLFGAKNLHSPQDMVNAYRRYFSGKNIHNTVYMDNFLSSGSFRQKFINILSKKIFSDKEIEALKKTLSVPEKNLNIDAIHELVSNYKILPDQEIILNNIYKTIIAVHNRDSKYLELLKKYIVVAANDKYEVVANYPMDRYDPESPDKKLLKYIISDMKRIVGD